MVALMFNPVALWNEWFALSARTARLCWDAQAVMLLRVSRMAAGGAWAEAEAQRMIFEKAFTLAEAHTAATAMAAKGGKDGRIAKKVLGVYGRRVRRNKRRLKK
jgi:hypothetical protein